MGLIAKHFFKAFGINCIASKKKTADFMTVQVMSFLRSELSCLRRVRTTMDSGEVGEGQVQRVMRVCAMMTLWSVAEYVLGVLTAGARALPILVYETQTLIAMPQREKKHAGRPSKEDVGRTMKTPLLQVLKARYGTLFSDKVLTLALEKVYEMYHLSDHAWRALWAARRPALGNKQTARGAGQLVLFRLWVVGLTTSWSLPEGLWMYAQNPHSRRRGRHGPSASGTTTSPFFPKLHPLSEAVVSSRSAVAEAMLKLRDGMYPHHQAPQVQLAPTCGEKLTIQEGEASASAAAAGLNSEEIVGSDSEDANDAGTEASIANYLVDDDASDAGGDILISDDDDGAIIVAAEDTLLDRQLKQRLQERCTRLQQ